MANINESDVERKAGLFFEVVLQAKIEAGDNWMQVLTSGKFYSFGNFLIKVTDEVERARADLIRSAVRFLGAKAGNSKAVSDLAWKYAEIAVSTPSGSPARNISRDFLIKLKEEDNAEYEFVAPNFLVKFADGVSSLKIGRVRALLRKDYAVEWHCRGMDKDLSLIEGEEFRLLLGMPVSLSLPDIMWSVNVLATRKNVEEEAHWLVNMAASLLRLQIDKPLGLHPRLGDREETPFFVTWPTHVGFKVRLNQYFIGDGSFSGHYTVTKDIFDRIHEDAFQRKVELIFSPPPGSLAERVGQALGWLARGRQSHDRSERMLLFFTAIEALLTGEKKDIPVRQTIAKHAAFILTDDETNRDSLYKAIKGLYDSRSKIVHGGHRMVTDIMANSTQAYADSLCKVILDHEDLSTLYKNYFEKISRDCKTLAWPSGDVKPDEAEGK